MTSRSSFIVEENTVNFYKDTSILSSLNSVSSIEMPLLLLIRYEVDDISSILTVSLSGTCVDTIKTNFLSAGAL